MHSTADYTVTTSIEKSAFLSASLIHWLMVTTKKILRLLPVGWQNYIFNINAKKVQVHGTIQERLSIEPHEILLNGIPLERESKFKYLCIHISANPSWSSQFCTICKKATRLIGMPYRRFYACADIQTCILLHVSYVWPHLEYMHRCMPGMGSSSQKGYWSTGVSSEIFTESVCQTMGHA